VAQPGPGPGRHATASAPGRSNEDYVCSGADWAIILDGATAPAGVDSGCVHDVVWLVRSLASAMTPRLILPGGSTLADILAAAIKDTTDAHADTCDLANPDSPSATVSIVRARGDALDYLTLGDSPIVLWHRNESFTPIADDRTSHLPGGRPYTIELVRAHRNKTGARARAAWIGGIRQPVGITASTSRWGIHRTSLDDQRAPRVHQAQGRSGH